MPSVTLPRNLRNTRKRLWAHRIKILVLETKLYNDLVLALAEFTPAIQINANLLARLDCLLSFAQVAQDNRYIRPVIQDDDVLDIKQGRHPVIEKELPVGEQYIANDVYLDTEKQQIIIITGPEHGR